MVNRAASSPDAQFQTADSYWTNLTDAELRTVAWTTDTPTSLTGLQDRIPANLPDFIIELEYQLDRSTDPAVPCAHCPHHQAHWHGFVLLASDGSRYLLGSHCGPKAYSSDYLVASSARNKAKKRAEALLAWEAARDRLPDILDALAETARDPGYVTVKGFRSKCKAYAPSVVHALASLGRNHLTGAPEMKVSRCVRDESAETARDIAFLREAQKLADLPNKAHRLALAELRARLGTGEIWKTEEGDYGVLQGAAWLVGAEDPFQMLDDAARRLRGYYLLGEKTGDNLTPQVQRFTRETLKDIELVRIQLHRISEAKQFFEPAHLRRLSAWAAVVFTEKTHRRISFDGGTLMMKDGYREPQFMRLAANWQPPGSLLLELVTA